MWILIYYSLCHTFDNLIGAALLCVVVLVAGSHLGFLAVEVLQSFGTQNSNLHVKKLTYDVKSACIKFVPGSPIVPQTIYHYNLTDFDLVYFLVCQGHSKGHTT